MKRLNHGFTLLEIIIALLILAIGLFGLIQSMGDTTWQTAHLKNKTLASFVAQNQISLYRAKRTWNGTKKIQGVTEMANTEWFWVMKISETDDDQLRRIDIEVALAKGDSPLATLTGFIGKL